MLIKRFVKADCLQQRQNNTDLIQDLLGVVLQVGTFLLDPTFKSTVANISNEKNLLKNFIFYKKEKMKFKEMLTASTITTAIQEALVTNNVLDEVGFGKKQQYSLAYGQNYDFVQIPRVRVKYHWDNNRFDRSSKIMILPSSSQLKILNAHDKYLAEFNQAIKQVGGYVLFDGTLNDDGWLEYSLNDLAYNSRLDYSDVDKIAVTLSNGHEWHGELKRNPFAIPITSDLVLKKPEHMLITAKTGMGKTELAFALAAETSWLGNTILYFLDPKHSDLSFFGQFLGKGRYADTTEDIDQAIDDLNKLMDKRYQIMKEMASIEPKKYVGKTATGYGFKQVTIYFDEVSAHLANSKKSLSGLKRLLMLGRQAGITVVLILQDPRATNNLPATLKDNSGIKIALGQLSGTLASLVFSAGVELPDIGRNVAQGFIQIDAGEPIPFDAPLMPNNSSELYKLMKNCLIPQKMLSPYEHY